VTAFWNKFFLGLFLSLESDEEKSAPKRETERLNGLIFKTSIASLGTPVQSLLAELYILDE